MIRNPFPLTRNPDPNSQRMVVWQWRILLATMACYLFYYCGRMNLQVCLKPIMDEHGWNKAGMGVLATVFIWSYGFGQLINGNLADRFGRVMMLLGALVSCGANWVFSFAPDLGGALADLYGWTNVGAVIFTTMALIWAVNAYFQAMGMGPGGRLIANWWPHEKRGLAMGLFAFAAGMANVTVFLLASAVAKEWGWRAAFRYPVLLTAAMAVVFYLVTKERPENVGLPDPNPPSPRRTKRAGGLRRWGIALKDVRFLLSCGSIGLHHIPRYGLLTFIPTFFMERYHWNIRASGFVAAALPLGFAVGAACGGYLSDRFFGGRRAKLIAFSLLLFVIFFYVLYLFAIKGHIATYVIAVSPPTRLMTVMTMLMLFIAGVMLYLSTGLYFALPADLLGPENAGTGIGVMDAAGYAGAGVGTAVTGFLIEYAGYPAGFHFMARCAVASALLMLLVRETGNHSARQ